MLLNPSLHSQSHFLKEGIFQKIIIKSSKLIICWFVNYLIRRHAQNKIEKYSTDETDMYTLKGNMWKL